MRPVPIPSSSARPPRASGARKSTVASTTSAENIGSCSEDASYSAATSSPKWFSGNRGFARACAVERELAVLCVDAHGVPVGELALEQAQRQWVLDHAVEELRPEELAHLLLRAQVRGHDQHGVAEVDGASVPVGQAAVVEDLQQDVEDLRVRLLDLVEEDHRVRTPSH